MEQTLEEKQAHNRFTCQFKARECHALSSRYSLPNPTHTSRQARPTSLGGGGRLSGHAAGLVCRGASNRIRHDCSH